MHTRTPPSSSDIDAVYTWGCDFARSVARGDTYTIVAHDAMTDGLMWAIANHDQKRGEFGSFARRVIRLTVSRHLAKARRRPEHLSLPEVLEAGNLPAAGPVPLPSAINDLPPDLRDAVRLFYLDGLSLRECALLLGCCMQTVRARLAKAAAMLDPDAEARPRRNGEKRMVRR